MADFLTAVKLMKEGKKVRRKSMDYCVPLELKNKHIIPTEKDEYYCVPNHIDNIEATDWEIVEKETKYEENLEEYLKRKIDDGVRKFDIGIDPKNMRIDEKSPNRLKFEIEEKPITKMKELKEKHPSIKVYVGVMPRRAVFNGTNEYTESSQDGCYYEDVQKYTRDVQRIRESLKKHLTAELGGQVAVMSEYYKIMRELELEEE